MTGYKGHLAAGTIAFGLTFGLLRSVCPGIVIQVPIALVLCLLGSLFPDIDTKSQVQLLLYRILFVCALLLFVLRYFWLGALLGIILTLPLVVHHRGIFHNLTWLILGSFGCAFLLSSMFASLKVRIFTNTVFFVAGVVSHLLMDVGLRRIFDRR